MLLKLLYYSYLYNTNGAHLNITLKLIVIKPVKLGYFENSLRSKLRNDQNWLFCFYVFPIHVIYIQVVLWNVQDGNNILQAYRQNIQS